MSLKKQPQFWELKKKPWVPYRSKEAPHVSEGPDKKCATCGNFANAHPSQESVDNWNASQKEQE